MGGGTSFVKAVGVITILDFFKSKSVFVTGHTGFKGAWLCRILSRAGAKVSGYALDPQQGGVYEQISMGSKMKSNISDIRDYEKLSDAIINANPEIVLHLAAQPLVLTAYERPAYTFETNIQGTVNLLDCVRQCENVRSVVIVTTDKVYRNNEWEYGYRENDPLGGSDPYSASKTCSEIVTDSYVQSFFRKAAVPVSTVRAGNAIGGGDVAANRIISDSIRSAKSGEAIAVRNPHSVRPYQHVLEPLFAYLMVAQKQYEDASLSGSYTIGPGEDGCVTTGTLMDIFCKEWGDGQSWINKGNSFAPHESGLLRLDCSKMRSLFGWKPLWNIKKAVKKIVEWEKSDDKTYITDSQIEEYAEEFGKCMN
jgi:CDP-glucose 4,6-dehydratase